MEANEYIAILLSRLSEYYPEPKYVVDKKWYPLKQDPDLRLWREIDLTYCQN